MMQVFANAVVVIILQHVSAPHQHVLYLKCTQCYMSILSESWKKKRRYEVVLKEKMPSSWWQQDLMFDVLSVIMMMPGRLISSMTFKGILQ